MSRLLLMDITYTKRLPRARLKNGEKEKVELETNNSYKKVDSYSCTMYMKKKYFDG